MSDIPPEAEQIMAQAKRVDRAILAGFVVAAVIGAIVALLVVLFS